MQNTCPNAGCGAQYNLTAQHVGRQFACRKCGTMLQVDSEGIKLLETPAALPAGAPPAGLAPSPVSASMRSEAAAQLLGSMKGNASSWVFGAGAVLVIIFAFFPLLDQFRASRLESKIQLEDARQERAQAEADKKGGEALKTRVAERKKWEQEDRPRMQQQAKEQAAEAGLNRWRDGWGMLLGFVLLALACMAWLRPEEPRIRKVVAAIILCAELLLIFISYTMRAHV